MAKKATNWLARLSRGQREEAEERIRPHRQRLQARAKKRQEERERRAETLAKHRFLMEGGNERDWTRVWNAVREEVLQDAVREEVEGRRPNPVRF